MFFAFPFHHFNRIFLKVPSDAHLLRARRGSSVGEPTGTLASNDPKKILKSYESRFRQFTAFSSKFAGITNQPKNSSYSRMEGFIIKTPNQVVIRFEYYLNDAPVTSAAFAALLPFTHTFLHARVSGHEIWIDNAPVLDIIQENASVFAEPGEVVYGPLKPLRAKTSNCMGIYYGEGSGLDSCNIFAKVLDEDMGLLKQLGEEIWKNGVQELTFEAVD